MHRRADLPFRGVQKDLEGRLGASPPTQRFAVVPLEILLGGALYLSAGLLSTRAHPPILLIVMIALQGTVYMCSLTAALWNLRAARVPDREIPSSLRGAAGPPSAEPAAVVCLGRCRQHQSGGGNSGRCDCLSLLAKEPIAQLPAPAA